MSKICRYNDPSTVLEGQLFTDFFFGRPGYGMYPETDQVEHAVVMALDSPISVEGNGLHYEGNYDGQYEENIGIVQISSNNIEILRQFRGCGIRLTGSLYHAHNGHHHTPVLLSSNGDPIVIDNRNTYPNSIISASGSGFLLGYEGHIATAAHVIENANKITVTRGLYRQQATVIDIEPTLDLAILKIDHRGALAAVIEKREARARPIRWELWPRLGERIYTFGFPLRPDLPHSLNMTQGLISSEHGIHSGHFQISAAIQDGSSGSPVFDEYGDLIGIVLSSYEPAQNVNFCASSLLIQSYCTKRRIKMKQSSRRGEKIAPTLLAMYAQSFCVEIEVWSDAE